VAVVRVTVAIAPSVLDRALEKILFSAAVAPEDDALRDRLLDAAARVFARQGYDGTKILDIVREAGLSTGAVYGRFGSKEELLREAVVRRSTMAARLAEGAATDADTRVADLVARGAALRSEPLADAEAVRLEAYVTARREPEVAAALKEANERWRESVEPLVAAALHDGTVADDVDPEAVLFFVRVLHLGLLLHRGSGLPGPDPDAWDALVARMVASFGRNGKDH
jgi:AcrR family transcriptional regulator